MRRRLTVILLIIGIWCLIYIAHNNHPTPRERINAEELTAIAKEFTSDPAEQKELAKVFDDISHEFNTNFFGLVPSSNYLTLVKDVRIGQNLPQTYTVYFHDFNLARLEVAKDHSSIHWSDVGPILEFSLNTEGHGSMAYSSKFRSHHRSWGAKWVVTRETSTLTSIIDSGDSKRR